MTNPPHRNKTASRRQFLRVGGLAGIGLPQLLYMNADLPNPNQANMCFVNLSHRL